MTILDDQRRRYLELWRQFGEDPRTLGHRDRETQEERFFRLARSFDREPGGFTVHEIGAGFGDFGHWLGQHHPQASYSGSEICQEFLDVCRERFPEGEFLLRDITADLPTDRYDYVTQSGTFNGRFGTPAGRWQLFVHDMLRAMYAMARKGIAVNFLTTYSDPERRSEDLHYQDPAEIGDFTARQLSRHFEIDAGGPLYEYTLRVYRPEYVRSLYTGAPFDRYFD